MNVETHEMNPNVARAYYLDYKKRVAKHREERRKKLQEEAKAAGRELGRIRIAKNRIDHEDDEMIKAYREMSLGNRVLILPQVLKRVGVDKQHLPKLAIIRADAAFCYYQCWRDHMRFSLGRNCYRDDERVEVKGANIIPPEGWNEAWRKGQNLPAYPVRAMVPQIPPNLRPAGDLKDYHILWEAKWDVTPPLDPMLLKRVSPTVFVVLAQWDLSPLERAVLEGRYEDR